MIDVTRATYVRDYRIRLRFDDGTKGVADLAELVKEAPLERLRDLAVFRDFTVDGGTVTWGDGDLSIAAEALYALAHGLPHAETGEQARANELEMSLREVRRLAGMSQRQASEAMGMNQGELSRFERRDDRMLSTLRRYIRALGGELQVFAVLGRKRIRLRGL
jgi:hypothetical protein